MLHLNKPREAALWNVKQSFIYDLMNIARAWLRVKIVYEYSLCTSYQDDGYFIWDVQVSCLSLSVHASSNILVQQGLPIDLYVHKLIIDIYNYPHCSVKRDVWVKSFIALGPWNDGDYSRGRLALGTLTLSILQYFIQ